MHIRLEEELKVLVCNRAGFAILMCAPKEGNKGIRKKIGMVFTTKKLYAEKTILKL